MKRSLFLKILLLGGLGTLAGCQNKSPKAIFMAAKETLPEEFEDLIPEAWRFSDLKITNKDNLFQEAFSKDVGLLSFGDGWIENVPQKNIQKLGFEINQLPLNKLAKDFLRELDPSLSNKIFPLAFSPWIMLFRKGDLWLEKARKSWDVLLDPDLKKLVVLPDSPRLIISIANKMNSPDSLRILRSQTLVYDDKNAVNWVNSGKARVAVLPLQRCLNLLRRDPRLKIAMPQTGSPINWTLLVRPYSTYINFPKTWTEKIWKMPYMSKLLSVGLIPPLPREDIIKGVEYLPSSHKEFVHPNEDFWEKCWSLPPMTSTMKNDQINIWNRSIP